MCLRVAVGTAALGVGVGWEEECEECEEAMELRVFWELRAEEARQKNSGRVKLTANNTESQGPM